MVDYNQNSKNSGYTLTELAIVIAIIGVLAGATIYSKALIKNAQLTSVIAEYNTIKNAIYAFQNQYGYLPGDFPNASTLWSTSTKSICTAPTCNGDGNGVIDVDFSGTIPVADRETTRMWQHLSLSGLLKQNYVPVSTIGAPLVGTTLPPSAYTNLSGDGGGSCWARDGWGFSSLSMSGITSFDDGCYTDGVSPNDTRSIDNKIDDGIAGTGNVMAYAGKENVWWWSANCLPCGNFWVSGCANNGYVSSDNGGCAIRFLY
jgi:prepilin-type N-terminal cleavage/methylation domain-containing protein